MRCMVRPTGTGRALLALLLLSAAALPARTETYNNVTYSTSGDIVPGELTSQFSKAKIYADKYNIPLVVVWANPGCGFCGSFERSVLARDTVTSWMASRKYVFVFCLGRTDSDGSSAWTYTKTTAYPMCRVHWKKNAAGAAVDYRFVGRYQQMHESQENSKKKISEQFMEVVDMYVGAYAGGSGGGNDPAPVPGGKTYKVTFNANGGTTSVKSRTVSAGAKVGTLPMATRSGYRLAGWFTSAKGDEEISDLTVVTKDVTFYAHWEKVYPLSVSVSPSGGGKVAGTGSYAAGESVTLTATATSGYVLSGWYSGTTRLSQEPSLVCEMGAAAKSLVAKFIKKADDTVTIGAFMTADDYVTGEAIEPIVLTASGGSRPTLTVKKLPPGLEFAAEKADGRAANTIFGTPTKSGSYSVQVFAKTLGGAKASAILPFVIRAGDERLVRVECDPEMGTVSGGGTFADGKRATVRATPLPQHCFTGWRIGGKLVSRSASYSFPVDGKDVTLVADFVTKKADLASVTLAVAGKKQEAEAVATNVVRCGVQLKLPVVASALSGTTVTASGLPAGLKLVKTVVNEDLKDYSYEIAGTPSSPSKTNAKTGLVKPTVAQIKVTTLGKSLVTYQQAFVVEALPAWAYGNFSGFAAADESGRGVGVATLTVSNKGRMSGKFALGGTNWSYSATGYCSCEAPDDPVRGKFRFEGVAKKSKLTRPLVIEVSPGVCNCSVADGAGDGLAIKMYRTVWKDKPVPLSPKLPKTEIEPPEGFGKMTVSVSAAGKASFAGQFADGGSVSASSTAFLDADGTCKAFLIVPESKKAGGYLDVVQLPIESP